MSAQQQSGSVPPPVNAANPVARSYAASLVGGAEASESTPSTRSDRSFSEALLPVAGLFFLGRALVAAYLLTKSLPHVSSTPYRGLNNSPATGWTVAGHESALWWGIAAVLCLASLYAGARILKSDERGRGIGVLVCLASLGLAAVGLSHQSSTGQIVWLGANAFVLWLLVASSFPQRR
jgi:hypothetical protein